MPAYDVEVTLTLNCVVRGDYTEDQARQFARLLADNTTAVNECISGYCYGVPEITEFSINDPGEDIDVDLFEEDE